MVESALDRRAELMLKYKERIIDGKGIAEKIKGELKQRIIVRQLSKWLPMKASPLCLGCYFISPRLRECLTQSPIAK
jgi:hypothetical protein